MWTYKDILQAIQGKGTSRDLIVPGFSIDTRTLKAGEIYIAIRGESLDGHLFVRDAISKGAVAAIVDHPMEGIPADVLIEVANTDQALIDLGQFRRSQLKGHIIGVTGSAGKTTTKEIVKMLCEKLGKTHASPKSFNNHWGVPLTLANAPLDAQYLIFEMGMNHPQEISRLTHMVKPHIALITTITQAHVGFLGSTENIARAKAEIFEGMDEKGIAILNGDILQTALLKEMALKQGIKNVLTFGESAYNASILKHYEYKHPLNHIQAVIMGDLVEYDLGLAGKHMAMNSLAALTVIKALGEDLSKVLGTLKNFKYLERRGQHLIFPWKSGTITVIDETFNATSMELILQNMELFSCTGRKIAILGDIREQGNFAVEAHRNLKDAIENTQIDGVFCCGELMGHLYEALPKNLRLGHFNSSKEAINDIINYINPGDLLLIKGSKSMKMDLIIDAIKTAHHDL